MTHPLAETGSTMPCWLAPSRLVAHSNICQPLESPLDDSGLGATRLGFTRGSMGMSRTDTHEPFDLSWPSSIRRKGLLLWPLSPLTYERLARHRLLPTEANKRLAGFVSYDYSLHLIAISLMSPKLISFDRKAGALSLFLSMNSV